MTSTDTGIDWDVITIPEVDEIVQQIAGELVGKYDGFVEKDNISQEGYIIVACRAPRVREQVEAGLLNYVAHELRMDLHDKFRTGHSKFFALDSLD